jgi:hypothetical protein
MAKMVNINESLSEAQYAEEMRDIMQDWAADTLNILKIELRKREGFVPSRIYNQIKHEVLFGAADTFNISSYLNFADEGRHVDMKRLEWRRRPIEQGNNFILDWVKKTGVNKFKFTPGYTPRSRQISDAKKASRVASAIIVSKANDANRYKRKTQGRWYNRTFYGMVSQLIEEILDRNAQIAASQVAANIKKTLEPDGTS